ncbi:uncharacterized protein LOC106871980 [Octopus bimaculoides]|uniref:Uncharacterized protein n=1 Tax=Octopus bimaculoides TaxID=37653 RepID=A0A0L8HA62_OCTBM|nr:uncharacterized protein LOC106871980 [Octopus bimaculoides]|eukprot:XP_014774258.1 PREDICTED: uncharacterized protein LOC106871980 [Octopus bimaculoides]
MRLTLVCCFFKKLEHIPGHLTKGKVRLYPYITERMKKKALEDLLRERNNLAILSKSFLSQEEEINHMSEHKAQKNTEFLRHRRQKTWYKHVVAEDCLKSLNVSKKWE